MYKFLAAAVLVLSLSSCGQPAPPPSLQIVIVSGGGYTRWIGDESFDTRYACYGWRAEGNAYHLLGRDGEVTDIITVGPGVYVKFPTTLPGL